MTTAESGSFVSSGTPYNNAKGFGIDGARLLPGRYTSESEELDGVLVDSGTDGTLVVAGGGYAVIIR